MTVNGNGRNGLRVPVEGLKWRDSPGTIEQNWSVSDWGWIGKALMDMELDGFLDFDLAPPRDAASQVENFEVPAGFSTTSCGKS